MSMEDEARRAPPCPQWTRSGSNRLPPPCHGGALPSELRARESMLAALRARSAASTAPAAPSPPVGARLLTYRFGRALGADARGRGCPLALGARLDLARLRVLARLLDDRGALALPLGALRDLDGDAVLLRALGNPVLGLKFPDDALERLAVVRSRQARRALAARSPYEVFGRRGRNVLLGASGTPPASSRARPGLALL